MNSKHGKSARKPKSEALATTKQVEKVGKIALKSKRKKSAPKHKLHALATIENQSIAVPSHHPEVIQKTVFSDAFEQALTTWRKQTYGTEDQELQGRLLSQAAATVTDFAGPQLENCDYVDAALNGIGPKDSLEGMLAVQMVAAHSIAMRCLRRAALPNQTDLGVEVYVNRGVKLMRTFASLTEALSRYRGKGEQKMIVEHVHIHKGGQAIVGQVTQNNSGKRGGGDETA
jgi:hypothetical protein